MRRLTLSLTLIAVLAAGTTAAAQSTGTSIVRDVRATIAAQDFAAGQALIDEYRSTHGVTPEMIAALSWLARGTYAAGQFDQAAQYSVDSYDLAVAALETHAVGVGVAGVEPEEIDRLGIGRATIQAMLAAVAALPLDPEYLLLDFVHLRECAYPFETVVRGDSLSYSIAGASDVAKVTRDRWMEEADLRYPGYSFARNKGYPTPQHLAQLRDLGPCPIHRRSFGPVRDAAGRLWSD